MTVRELLAACGLSLREARALLAHALDTPREWLVAHPDADVPARPYDTFRQAVQRRQLGEPMAYLLGTQEFYGRSFAVNPAVLIPRPETELLIDLALAAMRPLPAPRVLDLGTGSGCIAITLALERPDAAVVAVERSRSALEVAHVNARSLGARVEFIESDWFSAVKGRFDAILANPPYVAAGDPHLAGLGAEPIDALTDQADGLTHLRAIVASAPGHLQRHGLLAVEHGFDQGEAVNALFRASRFGAVQTLRDASGLERVCTGRWVPGE